MDDECKRANEFAQAAIASEYLAVGPTLSFGGWWGFVYWSAPSGLNMVRGPDAATVEEGRENFIFSASATPGVVHTFDDELAFAQMAATMSGSAEIQAIADQIAGFRAKIAGKVH